MWKWHPIVRWGTLGVVWLLWYGFCGPILFPGQPWFLLDPVRPWFFLQAQAISPYLLLWLGAAWGIFQDALSGTPIGMNALAYPSEVLLILFLGTYFDLRVWTGVIISVLAVEALHQVALAGLALLFGYGWAPSIYWIMADAAIAVSLISLYIRWNERSRLEYALRSTSGF